MPESAAPNRAATAAKIAANPTAYKVCEGCESIVGSGTSICPNCHGYRFDPASERVVLQARILGSRERRTLHRIGTSIRGNGGNFSLSVRTGLNAGTNTESARTALAGGNDDTAITRA